ncbi:MAG: hypothetical protein OXE84_05215 [Rhodobacteraceae bacterium]|nr:hypothetical protein [Paracoccaceae bacterium]MCY4197184.1 hypothetical protein [Paracoccaceae bacterium]MCY4327572.1 hypothetical protein [Paracoccaceae bacterium]
MSETPDIHDLARQIARLKGEITAVRAENGAMESRIESRLDTGLALLREDMAKWETAAAKRETDAVKREKQQLLAIAGLIALATTMLGILLIGLPG